MRPAAGAMRAALGLVALLALLALAAAAPQQTFSQAVTRAIDLTSQLVRETATINIDNTGAAPLERYELRTPDAAHLAYVGVKSKAGTELPLAVLQTGAGGAEAWEVQLVPPVPAGEKASLVATFVYINKMVPLPAHAPLLAPQKVRVDHTLHFYSPYHTHKERTTVTVPSGPGVVSKTENTVAVDGNKLTYGPFTDVAPLDRTELFVHFENNAPFAAVTSLVRTLEVSHWGNNLAVEEFFDVEHKGAKLEGQFSRLELMRAGLGAISRSNIIQSFTLPLPAAAADIYYRDVIGNISTSTVRPNVAKGVINLALEPRYPLVGGWKTKWYHGWNQPLSTVLHHREDAPGYVLEVPLATLFENAAVEQFELRVTLPEGAQNVELHAAVPLDDIHLERTATYLDITGRPVLVARRQRLVNEHNGIVYITYTLPSTALLSEPLALMGFFLLLFVTAMVYVRVDLSISKDAKSVQREQAEALVMELLALLDHVYRAFEQLEQALDAWKADKDTALYKANKDKAEAALKAAQEKLVKQAAPLQALDAAAHARVLDLAKVVDDKAAKVRRLHQDLLGAKGVATAQMRALENEISALSSQLDALVDKLAP